MGHDANAERHEAIVVALDGAVSLGAIRAYENGEDRALKVEEMATQLGAKLATLGMAGVENDGGIAEALSVVHGIGLEWVAEFAASAIEGAVQDARMAEAAAKLLGKVVSVKRDHYTEGVVVDREGIYAIVDTADGELSVWASECEVVNR